MGRYDDITPDELRSRLRKFARLIRAMDKQDLLLEKSPSLLRILGELRQMIFAWEVRSTSALGTPDDQLDEGEEDDPAASASLRIVREAVERERELQDELRDGRVREDPDE